MSTYDRLFRQVFGGLADAVSGLRGSGDDDVLYDPDVYAELADDPLFADLYGKGRGPNPRRPDTGRADRLFEEGTESRSGGGSRHRSSRGADADAGTPEMTEAKACKILGIPTGSPHAAVTKRYRELAKAFHPDAIPKGTPESVLKQKEHQMIEINQAYNFLKDHQKQGR